MGLEHFLTNKGQAGEFDSTGEFSLAVENQLGRLQTAIAAEPGNFALKIVQGLVASGATKIQCDIGRLTFTIVGFECRHQPEGLLGRFDDTAGQKRDANDDLVLGLLGGLGLGMREVAWQLSGGESVILGQEGLKVLGDSNHDERTIFQFKLGTSSFFQMLKDTIRIRGSVHHLLSNRCQYSPIPIKLGFRKLKAKEPGSWYTSKSVPTSKVGRGHANHIYSVTATYRYRYWGRLAVHHADLPSHSHRMPAPGGPVQCSADGTRLEKVPENDQSYYAFLDGHAIYDDSGRIKIVRTPEGRLKSTVFLPANLKDEGSKLVIVHRGVIVSSTKANIGNDRAIVISGFMNLDLDASTLAVVTNEKYDRYLSGIRLETGALLSEILNRRSFLPKGIANSIRLLYT